MSSAFDELEIITSSLPFNAINPKIVFDLTLPG
jgi:hypothetical protein